jgi:hypothetical protein
LATAAPFHHHPRNRKLFQYFYFSQHLTHYDTNAFSKTTKAKGTFELTGHHSAGNQDLRPENLSAHRHQFCLVFPLKAMGTIPKGSAQ